MVRRQRDRRIPDCAGAPPQTEKRRADRDHLQRDGSSAQAPGGGYIYRASKVAATNLAWNLAAELRSEGVAVGACHSGRVRTEMGGADGDLDVHESAAGLLARLDALSLDTRGVFEVGRPAAALLRSESELPCAASRRQGGKGAATPAHPKEARDESALGIPVTDRNVAALGEWLNDVSERTGEDRQIAYHAPRAGLHTLRDRLTVDETA